MPNGWERRLLLPVFFAGLFGACDSTLACDRCELALDTILTLREEGRAPLLLDTDLLRTSKGEWLAAPIADRGKIAVFDSAGRYLRSVGRAGNGPGEYGEIRSFTGLGPDTIALIHDGGSRGFDLLNVDGEFARKPILPVDAQPGQIHAISPRRWLIAPPAMHFVDGRRNARLFLLTPDSLQALIPASRGEPRFFKLIDAGAGRVLALESTRRVGRFLDSLGREVSSFPFRLPDERDHYPFHLGASVLRNDTLFTIVSRWRGKPTPEEAGPVHEEAGRPDLDLILRANEYFLDVRNSRSGHRIAFIALGFLPALIDPDHMVIRGQDSSSVSLHVARFWLRK